MKKHQCVLYNPKTNKIFITKNSRECFKRVVVSPYWNWIGVL